MEIRRPALVLPALFALIVATGCSSAIAPDASPASSTAGSGRVEATQDTEGRTPAPAAGELGTEAGGFRLGTVPLRNALIVDLSILCDTPAADTPSAGFVSLHCDREHKDGLMDIWMSSDPDGRTADVTVRFGPYPYPEQRDEDIAQVIAYLLPADILPQLSALVADPGSAEAGGLRLVVEQRDDDVVIRVSDSKYPDLPDPSS